LQWKLGVEAKLHYRHSDDNSILIANFPIDVGHPVTLSTVDPGSHIELSTVTLVGDASWGENLAGNVRIDVGNLYDRNPTSTGKKIIVHDAWLRLGREVRPAMMPEGSGGYFKLGKFAHFERQNDRHLESWGLLSTAFNRFSDVGFEGGVELGRFVYAKASLTTGNPLFIRDPNALAGDNGTEARRPPAPFSEPKLGSGFVIPYDTEVQDVGNGSNPQTSVGLGFHFSDESGQNGVDVLAWGRERKLADTVELEGTFYGGDLDLLNGPFNTSRLGGPFSLPLKDDKKKEAGANIWVYWSGLSVFGQYVDQKVAGLKRKGIEGEVAWRFDLPVVWGLAGGSSSRTSSRRCAIRSSSRSSGRQPAVPGAERALGLGEDRRRSAGDDRRGHRRHGGVLEERVHSAQRDAPGEQREPGDVSLEDVAR
jgi:hypothetical protein